MEKLPRARYTQEFKEQTVSLAVHEGLGIAEAARRLSVSPKSLANWVKRSIGRSPGATVQTVVSPAEAELSKLRWENAQLRMERDILKKAAAYFAKESL